MALAEADGADRLCAAYLDACIGILRTIHQTQAAALDRAAALVAARVAADGLVHIYGPGGHSALAAQELFYRAGGLMHLSPILDEATALPGGALRSTAMERLPGHGRVVIEQAGLAPGDLLILVNAFGVNAALIDAALAARALGVTLIGISSHAAAARIPLDHPARHPGGETLDALVDVAIDSGVPDGDASVRLAGLDAGLGPVSTYANAFALNALVLRTIAALAATGQAPPIWRSRNAAGGDANDPARVDQLRQRVKHL